MLFSDSAVSSESEDKLDRYPLAKSIAKSLVESNDASQESVVVGINGEWGSGKSTFIDFICREIETISTADSKEFVIIRFNPWMFTGKHELLQIFFNQLVVELKIKGSKWAKLANKIGKVGDYFTWVQYVDPSAGTVVKSASSIFKIFGKEKGIIELRSAIDQAIVENRMKLYIVIDDIDRLTPSEISDIFQLIKLNANFKNTVFITAYDKGVVASAMNNIYDSFGLKYLEKIVQVDYTLPAIGVGKLKSVFKNVLFQRFPELESGRHDIDIEAYLSQAFLEFVKNMRDIYRLINSIALRLPLIFEELNICDFLSIETIRIFMPELYSKIRVDKKRLTSGFFGSDAYYNRLADVEKRISLAIDSYGLPPSVNALLKSVFNTQNENYNSSNGSSIILNRRIVTKTYFDRYFRLQLQENEIPQKVFNKILYGKIESERKEELLCSLNTHEDFLRLLKMKIPTEKDFDVLGLVSVLLESTMEMKYPSASSIYYSGELHLMHQLISGILYRIGDFESRRSLFMKFINNNATDHSFSKLVLISSIASVKDLLDKGTFYQDNLWYYLYSKDKKSNDKFYNNLVEVHNNLLIKIAIRNRSSFYLSGTEYLELYRRLFNSTDSRVQFELDKERKYLYENADYLLCVLSIILEHSWGTASVFDGRRYGFGKFELIKGLDVDLIKARLDKIDRSMMSKRYLVVTDLFLLAYKDNFEKNIVYDLETMDSFEFNFDQ